MTEERMALIELVEKQADGDLVREMLAFAAERIMEAEVEARTGATKGARSPLREVQRNGYRDRDWDTRAGRIALESVQKCMHALSRCVDLRSRIPTRGAQARHGLEVRAEEAQPDRPRFVVEQQIPIACAVAVRLGKEWEDWHGGLRRRNHRASDEPMSGGGCVSLAPSLSTRAGAITAPAGSSPRSRRGGSATCSPWGRSVRTPRHRCDSAQPPW